jgi:competence protein ComEC
MEHAMAGRTDAVAKEREGRYAAFLTRFDPPPSAEDGVQWGDHRFEQNKRRAEFLFEAIKLEALEASGDSPIEPDARPLVRLLTTPARFTAFFGREPTPGDWFLIELTRRPNGPLVWTGIEDAGDIIGSRPEGVFSLRSAQYLDPTEDLAPQGTSGALSFAAKTSISNFEIRSSPARRLIRLAAVRRALKAVPKLFVDAIDVGQASFVAVHDQRNSYLFFDVGRPLWFHKKSLPSSIRYCPPHDDAAVILSHWDYDHYSGVYNATEFRKLLWIAPADKLGPTSYNLAKSLGSSLIALAHGVHLRIGRMRLGWATGPTGDRNNRGIVGLMRVDGRRVLLTGDASYQFISKSWKANVTGVQVPHHGSAHSAAPVPKPNSPAVAVICTGIPNRYRHPSSRIIAAHSQWRVSATGRTPTLGTRGNKSF